MEDFFKSYGLLKLGFLWVPHGLEVKRWLCNQKVSGSIPSAGNLEKLVIWMKIYGHKNKNSNIVIDLVS